MEASSDTLFTAGNFTSHLMKLLKESNERDQIDDDERLLLDYSQSQLIISPSEVSQLLEEVREVAELKRRDNVTEHTWAALCVACVLLVARKQNKLRPQSRGSHHKMRKSPLVSRSGNSEYDVFLGGSCNPTSWRKDIVIPYLQREGITFYNPQVEHWCPELIDIEEEAKQAASTLLYVVDNQTRAVSSMIEVAYFVGSNRNVLVVVNDITGEAPTIGRDELSPREVEDLNRGRSFIRLISEESGSLVESNIRRAVASLIDLSRMGQCECEKEKEEERNCSNITKDLMSTKEQLVLRLRLLRSVHDMYDIKKKGHLTIHETERALQALESHCRNHSSVTTVPTSSIKLTGSLPWKLERISFEMFMVLYSEWLYQRLMKPATGGGGGRGGGRGGGGGDMFSKTSSYLKESLFKMTGWLWSAPPPPSSSQPSPLSSSSPSSPPSQPTPPCIDIYLGGSCGNTSWRQDDVIPILDQYGVTYFNPQVTDWHTSLISVEQAAQNQCSVLLYVISGDTLGVGSLVEVAYCVGQRRKMVLVLSDIPSPSSPDSTTILEDNLKLSERAVRDYNRGRAYLSSMARKRDIPIYTDLVEATLRAVYLAKGYDIPPSQNALLLQGTSV